MSELITIGKVVGTFGLKGYLKIWPATDFPERFEPGSKIWLAGNEYLIEDHQWHKKQVRVRLKGVHRLSLAEPLIGLEVGAQADERPRLEKDEYLIDELIGLDVFDTEGAHLGKVDEVLQAPAQDIYRIGSALVPAVSEFIKDIDIGSRRMVIAPIPGMFDNED